MAGLAERVTDALGVPVVDGVGAAVGLAESIFRLGLRTSKVGMYAPSPHKDVFGWPLA
jgi:allantoin racemase